jgi:hypothetical protein
MSEGGGLRNWINEGAGRLITVLVAVGALAAAAAWAYHVYTGNPSNVQAIMDHGREVLYVCKACRSSGTMRVPYYTEWPQVCPKEECAKPRAVPGFRCRNCKRMLTGHDVAVVRCGACGFVHDRRGAPKSIPLPSRRKKK